MWTDSDSDDAQQGSTETRRSLWSLYFSFRGRINRKTFWLAGIIPGISIGIVGIVLLVVLRDYVIDPARVPVLVGIVAWSLQIYLWLWGFWVMQALLVKRFHDSGRSGWNLLWWLVPLIGETRGVLHTWVGSEHSRR